MVWFKIVYQKTVARPHNPKYLTRVTGRWLNLTLCDTHAAKSVALIIAAILGFALLQYLSISALDSLIEEAESQDPAPPV
ncbi:MAG: hypothetical protein AAGG45_09075 [Pseudomonadota bacterium]